jgi:putative peptidoglycan lipid II flippase
MTEARSTGLARATLIVMTAFVASRVLGLIREMLIGRMFGGSAELDAYLAAFRIPDLLFNLVAGGAVASAFIPVFSGMLAGQDEDAWRLASAVFNAVSVGLAALAALAWIGAPQLVSSIVAPGFDPQHQALTAVLMRRMLAATVILGASGVVMGAHHSQRHFLSPALAPLAYNLAIIGAAMLLAPHQGVHGLATGVVAGAVLHLAVQMPWLTRYGGRWYPQLGLSWEPVRQVGGLMLPRVVGLGAVQVHFIVNTMLASRLAQGSITALNFAWLLALLPQGVFGLALATAVFPTFARQAALDQRSELRRTLTHALGFALYMSLPAAVGLVMLRQPLIQVLFQRGAFDARTTAMTAYALQFFALGLIAHIGLEIVTRAFYALKDTRTPVAIGVAAMGLNVALSAALSSTRLVHGGLALANAIATTVECGVLAWLLRQRLGGIGGAFLAARSMRIGAATLVMAVSLQAALPRLGLDPLSALAVGLPGGAAVYFVASHALGESWQPRRARPPAAACLPDRQARAGRSDRRNTGS